MLSNAVPKPGFSSPPLLQPWCLFTNTAGNSQKQRAVLLLFGLPNRWRSRISAANETSLTDNLPRNSENSDAALAAPQSGGGVSGVVMTSVASGAGSCSESFFYSDPGTGAPPKVEVSRSGDCGMDTPAITGRQPSVLPASPAPRPNQPRLIEASAGGRNLPPAAKARHLAELIKSTSPG